MVGVYSISLLVAASVVRFMGNSIMVTSGIGNYHDASGKFKYWPLNNSTVPHIRYWLNKTNVLLHPCAINDDETHALHDELECSLALTNIVPIYTIQ